ncbi:hypothetical protein KUTeg_015373 [Tegillarca granosa]|uniref:Death domain-containing protein n=1 Tax=Tegillarca granosa TaxID=220873 RepID=A0ABQ9EQK2_TEGGR|nr:hypothetical protein KUTeg_015373 [Tegillarca granosa]
MQVDKVEESKETESRIKDDEEERIDSKTIRFIANSIGIEWSEVATCLGFSRAQKDQLTENYRISFDKIESMISYWLIEVKRKGIPNPRRLLANCIGNVDACINLAYKIDNKFKEVTLPKDLESSIQEIIIGKHHQQEDQQKVQQTCQECKRNVKEEDDVMKNKHSEKRRRTIESEDQDVEDDVIQNKQSKKRRRTEESEDQESVKPGSSCDEPKSVDDQKKEILYTIDDIPSKVQKIESSENEEKQGILNCMLYDMINRALFYF